jgi:hypothetical protein
MGYQVSTIPKARYVIYYDYWFLDNGVLRIKLLSPLRYILALVLWLCFFEVFALIFPDIARYVLLADFCGIILLVILAQLRVKRQRRNLSHIPVKQIMESAKIAKFIPWQVIIRVFIKGRGIVIQTTNESYKAKTNVFDSKPIQELLLSKIGSKLSVSHS